ncbi:MAG: hypothetical protein AMS16_00945 [Planctomycetes bacterium DG_58]|nr:MAG: hypothetical protein AMS16_00945 [Planctomycetes bacterium DG_58]
MFACMVACWLFLLAWRQSLMGPPDDFGHGSGRWGSIGRDRREHFAIWPQEDSSYRTRFIVFFYLTPDNTTAGRKRDPFDLKLYSNVVETTYGIDSSVLKPTGLYIDGRRLLLPAETTVYYVSDTQPFVQILLSKDELNELKSALEHLGTDNVEPLTRKFAMEKLQAGAFKPLEALPLRGPPSPLWGLIPP